MNGGNDCDIKREEKKGKMLKLLKWFVIEVSMKCRHLLIMSVHRRNKTNEKLIKWDWGRKAKTITRENKQGNKEEAIDITAIGRKRGRRGNWGM